MCIYAPWALSHQHFTNVNNSFYINNVLAFGTSVSSKKHIKIVQPFLNKLLKQNGYWNFDLEDCDNILRVETQRLSAGFICETLQSQGFYCEELL